MKFSDDALATEGRRVLVIEARAVAALGGRLGEDFTRACRLLAEAPGRVVVSGLGKSGHVARKIAGTLTSTGTPATFVHTVEALHGDLGVVGREDVAIFVSKSGEGREVEDLLAHFASRQVPVIAITANGRGRLARGASAVLDSSVEEEACPWDLAPTTSTTAALAMGDALAMVVLKLKRFDEKDFAALHPGGSLGRRLTLRVRDVMEAERYPALARDSVMRDAIAPLATMRGTVPVVDETRRVVGVLTAGDLTRLMDRDQDFLLRPVVDVMNLSPKTASPDELGAAAIRRMEKYGVMALPVVDDQGTLTGVVHLHDLMRSGVT